MAIKNQKKNPKSISIKITQRFLQINLFMYKHVLRNDTNKKNRNRRTENCTNCNEIFITFFFRIDVVVSLKLIS